MKPLEEAFSAAGFRSVVLPGVVFTIGVHPILASFLSQIRNGYGISESVMIVVEVIVWGLLISSATSSIYYLYEGFSLPWLTWPARRWNEHRLAATQAEYERILAGREYSALGPEEQQRAAIVHETLTDFPLRRNAGVPQRYAERPTLLGNIIAVYELYPQTRYGIDGVYFWFHLIALAPESVAGEFREKYAFAEGMVITSFAGAAVAMVNAILLCGYAIGWVAPDAVLAKLAVGGGEVAALLVFGIVVFVLFYRLALPAHRKAGRLFCTLVDLSSAAFGKWCLETQVPPDATAQKCFRNRKRYLNSLKDPI